MKNYFTRKSIGFLFCFSIIYFKGFGQNSLLAKANELYESKSFAQAIDSYEKILKKNPSNLDVIAKVADSYRQTNNITGAEKYYAKLVTMSNSQPIDKYYYGQILVEKEKYAEAKTWLSQYTLDDRGAIATKAIDEKQKFYKDAPYYRVAKISINSDKSDFSPTFYKNGIVFVSSRNRTSLIKRTHSWTNNGFTRLYYTEKDSTNGKSHYSKPFGIAKRVKSKYNDGPASFSKKQDIMYFTRNNVEGRKVRTSSDGIVKLKIFQSESIQQESNFENARFFPYNSDEYNCAHSVVSADGSKLYFSSDMPGGLGGMDIYISNLEGGVWGKPINLGANVNTTGNELFPFVAEDGTIYFASNGREGLGGLDIYSTHFTDGKFSIPENIGSPINSNADDFGFVINKESAQGYFSSSRENLNMNDDIYEFESSKPKKISILINVADAVDKKNIETSILSIVDSVTKINSSYTSENGSFNVELEPQKEYIIEGMADNYYNNSKTITLDGGQLESTVYLEKILRLNIIVFNNPKERKPIKKAIVNLKGVKGESYSATTDDYGKISNVPLIKDNNYELTARANINNSAPVLFSTLNASPSKIFDQTIFIENLGAICAYGSITDLFTNNAALEGANIAIKNQATGENIYESVTGADGKYKNCALQAGKKYTVTVSKEGYFTKSEELSTMGVKPGNVTKQDLDFEKSLALDKIIIGKAVKIDNIYFDVAKWNIRKDAAVELDKVVKLMAENPEIIIELGSHTDCRGSSVSNAELSEKRAKSSVDYIISKGVALNRITGKGYGEAVLVNKCECEGDKKVPCTDKEHQQNRRTEFKVVGFLQKDGSIVKPIN
jgi:outer membrane protein OmpA-like peptidoglycan-associated protein